MKNPRFQVPGPRPAKTRDLGPGARAWFLRFWALGLCAAAALLPAGCGVEGEPLPPLLNVPQPAEIHGVQRGNKALLVWAMPPQTTEGQAIRPDQLGSVEVYRAVAPGLRAQVTPQEFEAAARRVAELPAMTLEYGEELTPARAGNTVAYAVRLLNRRGDSAGFSNIVSLPVLAAPATPGPLRVQATERAIQLEWPPAQGASVYLLYRAEGTNPFQLLAELPQPRYSDEAFEFGKEYQYVIRAAVVQGAFRAESVESPIATVQPRDVFAPAVPGHVTALPVDGPPPAVELSWDPNGEADLAGYNVFRSDGGAAPRRLNPELLVSPTFRDPAVKPGARYSYSVTAVDRAGNESARSEPAEARLNP